MSQEIVKRGKSFTDGEYFKSCIISVSKEIFADFKNKTVILNKFESIPFSSNIVGYKLVKMVSNVTKIESRFMEVIPDDSGCYLWTTSVHHFHLKVTDRCCVLIFH